MQKSKGRNENHKRLKWLNCGYLLVSIAATVWVLLDLYSVMVSGGGHYPESPDNVLSSFLNLPILAGGLVFLFTLYKYPLNKLRQSENRIPVETGSVNLEECLVIQNAGDLKPRKQLSPRNQYTSVTNLKAR